MDIHQPVGLTNGKCRKVTLTVPFLSRLRHAGIQADDNEELKIRKTIMVFAMELTSAALGSGGGFGCFSVSTRAPG